MASVSKLSNKVSHHVRLTTRSVITSSALLASLSGRKSRTSFALTACARARSRVRSTPEDLRTRSLAYVETLIQQGLVSSDHRKRLTSSTSPSCSNFRAISGPISTCSSQAYRAGPVASPRRKSAPPGLPRVASPDS